MANSYWLFVGLTLALTGFLGYATFSTARLLQSWRPQGNLMLLPGENLLRLGMIGACWVLGRLSGLEPGLLGWGVEGWSSQLVWGVGIGLGMAVFFVAATRWLVQRTGSRFYSDQIIDLIVPTSNRELVWVAAALLPAVLLEELLFRSLLLGGLAPILPVGWLLVGFGVVFGLLHNPQGTWGMIGAGLAGTLFGVLFLWQGSLILPVVAHYVANLAQIVVAMRMRA